MINFGRKTIAALLAAATLTGVVEASETTGKAAITSVLNSYERALNAGDVPGILRLYAEDGVFMPQHSPSQAGATAVKAAYEAVFDAIDLDIAFDIIEVEQLSADWAFARTTSAGTVTVNANGATIAEANQELFLLRKQPDGVWKIARYIFSTTNSPR